MRTSSSTERDDLSIQPPLWEAPEPENPPKSGQGDRRKKGAPATSHRSRKRGLYASLRPDESAALEVAEEQGLEAEIRMMRILLRRLFEVAEGEEASLAEWLEVVNAAGAGFTRLAGLMRTDKLLSGGGNEVAAALSEALKDVNPCG